VRLKANSMVTDETALGRKRAWLPLEEASGIIAELTLRSNLIKNTILHLGLPAHQAAASIHARHSSRHSSRQASSQLASRPSFPPGHLLVPV